MSQWLSPGQKLSEIDPEVLEETAIATAQAIIQNAMNEAKISRAALAKAMGRAPSFISMMMSGTHNLTIRTLSRALAACGFEPEFGYRQIAWGLVEQDTTCALTSNEASPAAAGAPLLALA
jgi:plasmid maintenance system antidote protein VapI